MRNERLVISRERLLEEVWGYDPMAMTNTIDVFISNLRRKLEAEASPAFCTPSAERATCSGTDPVGTDEPIGDRRASDRDAPAVAGAVAPRRRLRRCSP